MADNKPTVTTKDNITTETYTVKKNFWETYSKPIIYMGGALIIILAAYFGYQKLVKEPNEFDAAALIFPAESLFDKMAQTGFNKDSVNIVLNGGVNDGVNVTGLLKVASKYSGTVNANRAEYMIGACYLHIKEFDKAIQHLKDYNSNGATQVEIKKYILLGNAYAEQKKTEDALSAYKKAAAINVKDETFTADALITAAAYADYIGKPREAIELYQKAQDNFPNFPTVQSGEVEKHLAKLGVTK